MTKPTDVKEETRWLNLRASLRMNSRVPVALEWTDGGRTLRVEGHTVDVSAQGCLAIVPQGFTVGQRFRMHNLASKKSVDAVLIWQGQKGRSGWELGIELNDAPQGFWELDF